MLKLHEYQSKRIFAQHGIPIPRGEVAVTPAEARDIAARLGTPVIIKAQVLVGGRGKAGGIIPADTPNDAELAAARILCTFLKGLLVRRVLVEEAIHVQDEIYLGITLDRARRRVVMIASAAGGIDIEEVARETPEKIVRAVIDPFLGLREYQARSLAYSIGLQREMVRDFASIAMALYQTYITCDASLAEINPLAITEGGRLIAVDGKMVIDDNALFRHPDLAELRDPDDETPEEREARLYGLSYVKLDGEIGCMVNGAGLAMATMDLTELYGGSPANFLDIGGGAQADKVAAALRIILSDPNVKAVLVNIFGGITRCDEVAHGILEAIEEIGGIKVPMVVRLVGTNEEEGRRILSDAQLITATSLPEAAQKAVAAAQGEVVV